MMHDENSRRIELERSLAILRAAWLPGMSIVLGEPKAARPAAVVTMPRALVDRCKCGRVISANRNACLMCKAEEIASR
jgi:hypothetical protein